MLESQFLLSKSDPPDTITVKLKLSSAIRIRKGNTSDNLHNHYQILHQILNHSDNAASRGNLKN